MAGKVIVQEYDFSSFVPAMSGIKASIVVNSSKGEINVPTFITDVEQYIAKYGEPHPSRGVSEYSAITYLTYGGPMYVVRSAHNTKQGKLSGNDPKYPCALVRSKIDAIPASNVIPDPDYVPQKVLEPLDGLTQHELDAYNFSSYSTHREYEYKDIGIMKSVLKSKEMKVFSFADLEKGDNVSFTPTIYVKTAVSKGSKTITVNDTSFCNVGQNIEILNTNLKISAVDFTKNIITLEFALEMDLSKDFPIHIVPFDKSANYKIEALEEKTINYDLLTLNKALTADKAEPVRLVTIAEKTLKQLDATFSDVEVVSKIDDKTIEVNTVNGIVAKHTLKIDGKEYVVESVDANNNKIVFALASTQTLVATAKDAVTLMERTYKVFEDPVFVVRSIKASTQLIVTNSDYIKNGEIIALGSGLTTAEDETKLISKDLYKETQKWVTLDKPLVAYTTYRAYKMTHSEFEERDIFLVHSINQGVWGNEIELKISDSKIKDAFHLEVYKNGVTTGEKFHCSMQYKKDGFGNQLYIESVINGKSAYIGVKVNSANVDDKNVKNNPLTNNYSLWRKDPIDIFSPIKPTSVKIEEDVILGDVEIMVSENSVFKLGNRIKFEGFPEEYKILDVTTDVNNNKVIKLDRKIKANKIPNDTTVLRYDHTQYFAITQLEKAYLGYEAPCDFILAGASGSLIDAGVNNLRGGNCGSAVTIGDLMVSADTLNHSRFKFQLLLDGGFCYPAYAQKLVTIAEDIMTCFVYLSTDINAELSVNYVNDIIDYRNKTGINSSWAGIFTPHVKIYDQYNQMEVWVSPEAFAASKQAFVERSVVMWMPAAGWKYGKILVLDLVQKLKQGEIDLLNDEHQINCLKYEDGDGVAIWGNETMLTMPSYLQMRHIRMLLILIETGLKAFLKYETFQLNDSESRDIIIFKLNKWFEDSIAKAVYDFQILDVTNDSNVSNREGVFRIMFSPKTSMEKIVSQVVVTSKGFDFGLVNI